MGGLRFKRMLWFRRCGGMGVIALTMQDRDGGGLQVRE